jgi:hypothetical protein
MDQAFPSCTTTHSSSADPLLTQASYRQVLLNHGSNTTDSYKNSSRSSHLPSQRAAAHHPDVAARRSFGPSTSPNNRHSFRSKIKELAANEAEMVKALMRSEPPQPSVKATAISHIGFQAYLTKAASQDKVHSFKTLFTQLTKVAPLGLSIIADHQVEIFIPSDQEQTVRSALPAHHLFDIPQLTDKDVNRRAASFNRSHFQLLSQANLAHASPELQIKILDRAQESLPKLPMPRQQQLEKAINLLRKQVVAVIPPAAAPPAPDHVEGHASSWM